jgi:hypothetical protein
MNTPKIADLFNLMEYCKLKNGFIQVKNEEGTRGRLPFAYFKWRSRQAATMPIVPATIIAAITGPNT